jgi:hypothetical protein
VAYWRRQHALGRAGAGAIRAQLLAGAGWVRALWLDDNRLGPKAAAILAEVCGGLEREERRCRCRGTPP